MLFPSSYYHIYNRANGSENLFIEERNFIFFLNKWEQYINPIAVSCAWCLMPNHFHFLVKIKEEEALEDFLKLKKQNLQGLAKDKARKDLEGLSKVISQQFSNLFNSYTKSFNKVYNRKGSLFIPNFKYKQIDSEDYLKQVVLYIHNNPVHHGFTSDIQDWKYSSIHSYLNSPDEIQQNIIKYFGHTAHTDFKNRKELLLTDNSE